MKNFVHLILPAAMVLIMLGAWSAAPLPVAPAVTVTDVQLNVSIPTEALEPEVEPTEFLPTLAPTRPSAPTATPDAAAAAPTGVPTLAAAEWQDWPVIPVVSRQAKRIYQNGLALGNDPKAFSKVGDCQNVSSYFLAVFEKPGEFRLGPYAGLQATVDYFSGSFARNSLAVRGGFNVASVLSPFWADPAACNKGENPLACELRVHRPSLVIISMETWWSGKPVAEYESYLRQIVAYAIERGTLPILATKADNWEGDHSINAAIARVAADYQVPLWNFWAAVQPLPHHGLSPDKFHLTYARNFFDDPVRLQSAWPVRNLTALQTLEAMRQELNK